MNNDAKLSFVTITLKVQVTTQKQRICVNTKILRRGRKKTSLCYVYISIYIYSYISIAITEKFQSSILISSHY